jgi:hypothetical protein
MRMTSPARFATRHRFIGVGVLVGVGILFGFSLSSLRRSPPAPLKASAEFLALTHSMVAPAPSLFERWVPKSKSWGWLWRLRDKVRGPKERVSIQATVLEYSGDAEQIWIVQLGDPLIQTNGMCGWVADDFVLRELEFELGMNWRGKKLMRPAVTTSHGILSSIWSGTSGTTLGTVGANTSQPPVGLGMELLSKAHGGGTELMTRVRFSESVTNGASPSVVSIRTNLEGAAQWQLPPGTGCVLLGPAYDDGSRRSAILLSVQIQRPK